MIGIFLKYGPWAILLASFLLPLYFYSALPDRMLIARGVFGGDATFAERSLFTVFRVPLIEMVCALAVVLLGRTHVRAEWADSFRALCTILLFTVALKSLFQSLETISSPETAYVYFYLTVGIVGLGIVSALIASRSFIMSIGRDGFELGKLEKFGLLVLLAIYVGLAIVPILYFSSK
jgi:uncharacterized membrane protein